MGGIVVMLITYVALFLALVFIASPDGQRFFGGVVDWVIARLRD